MDKNIKYSGLPDKWAIRITDNNRDKIKEWLKRDFDDKYYQRNIYHNTTSLFHYPNYASFNNYWDGNHLESFLHENTGYIEITNDQFLTHVIGYVGSPSQSIDNDILIHF